MKKQICILILAILTWHSIPVFAQDRNNEDEVVHLDPMSRYNARPGQVIVKFHDRSDIRVSPQNAVRFASPTRNVSINTVLAEYDVAMIEQLLPDFEMPAQARSAKSYGGKDVVERDLSQLHLITLNPSSTKNEYELIEALKELDEVEFAEPNYICYALGNPVGEAVSEVFQEVHGNNKGGGNGSKPAFTTNDPMYTMQWGIPACHIDSLLAAPKIHPNWRPIIAFLDTGVDIDHPDLAANIWTNLAEANGANNVDDDGNGLKDDIHGWDFVNQTGEMHDFNSHGTHCAGIAAAVGNNGIGITGACPDAYIMPITVMQSDGTGDIATIIKGVNYAAQNGADIISMSIGTYAYSIAFEQALGQAYQNAVLVAAAGNDRLYLDYPCTHAQGTMYPAAFTFVLGVQSTDQDGSVSSFTNIDCSGPSFSLFGEEELYNYELSAPGTIVMSTVPCGQYRSYNGTSMACPLVAGGIASLLQRRDYQTKEILFGDLINYSQEFVPVNFLATYNGDSIAPAILQCVAIEVNDTLNGDASMYPDAGERIQLYPTIRTVWGPTDSLEMWLEFQEFEDTNTLQIIQNHVQLGHPLSAYAKGKSLNPIDVIVDSNVVDGRHIRLTLCVTAPNAPTVLRHDFVLNVTNGVKLHGVLLGNHTLYPNVQYIVTNNLALDGGDTLFVRPGTTIKIKDECSINALIIAEGKADSIITFTKTNLGQNWNTLSLRPGSRLEYCKIEYGICPIDIPSSYQDTLGCVQNCVISKNVLYNTYRFNFLKTILKQSNIINNTQTLIDVLDPSSCIRYCNFASNTKHFTNTLYRVYNNPNFDRTIGNNFIFDNDNGQSLTADFNTFSILSLDTNYYGSSQETTIREHVYDFETPGTTTFGWFDFSKRASRPSPLAHGIVWKVEVNGYDAQDEFDSIVPLGVGMHEFKVYFNRTMDTSVVPIVAMGVRPPYTQTAIGENAYWSADSTIYTCHVTLTGHSAIDGLNRIYVANAQDNEHFEIPYENQRFNVYVASSGSMSMGFQATAGIGKVDLEWNDQEVNYDDFLGFNMYRYQYDSLLTNYHYDSEVGQYVYDTIWGPTDTIRLNTTLIQDTVFTDFDVVPGERYYYYYKILSTSLTENSPSKNVSCVPLSSIPGDANGSFHVDVADVITTINFITGQNPQPFLFGAADVNGDGEVNVLDIVGIINIILHPDQYPPRGDYEQQTGIYTVEDGVLYVNTPVALSGLQFTLANCIRDEIEVLSELNGFEIVTAQTPDNGLILVAYSMSGMQVPVGKSPLLRIGDKQVESVVLSDADGHNVIALYGDANGLTDIEALPAQIMKAYPNPFEQTVQFELVIGDDHFKSAKLLFTDMLGRVVATGDVPVSSAGKYYFTWNANGKKSGVYFATLYIDGVKAQTIKLILK